MPSFFPAVKNMQTKKGGNLTPRCYIYLHCGEFFYKINFSIYINQDISFASDVLVLYCLFIVIMQIEVDQNKFKGAADVVALWRKCDGRKDLKM